MPSTLEDLRVHDALVYGGWHRVTPWTLNVDNGPVEIMLPSRIMFDDLEAIADGAASGAGVAWLPTWLIAERLRSRQLVEVLPNTQGPGFEVFVLWPSGRNFPLGMRVLVDALVATVPARLEPSL